MRTAYAAHAGQVDKCGTPYIFHPIHLAEQMPDEISVCAALLHDVAEDTDITLSELESEFPSAVIDVLKLLTHKDGIDYFDYIRAIRSNPTAVRVKLADIAHNSDETRYAGCSEIDAEQLAARAKSMKKQKPFFKRKIQTLLNVCFVFDNRLIADSGTLSFLRRSAFPVSSNAAAIPQNPPKNFVSKSGSRCSFCPKNCDFGNCGYPAGIF